MDVSSQVEYQRLVWVLGPYFYDGNLAGKLGIISKI